MKMFLQICVTFTIIQLSIANHPVIFQKDNSVIATEPMKASLPQEHTFIPVHYPHYEVVSGDQAAIKRDILPNDLIQIATTKLGIKNSDEIPSISELAELLGTSSREETIDTIRQLTATESGIDLIKAFIESSDYTDHTGEKEHQQIEADTSGPSLPVSLLSETAQKDIELLQKIVTTPKPELSFFQRASAYFNFFDIFPENKEIPLAPVVNDKETQQPKPARTHKSHHVSHRQRHPKLQPILVAHTLPSSFPVPIMPGAVNPSSSNAPHRQHPINENRYLPHLNRPILEDRYLD